MGSQTSIIVTSMLPILGSVATYHKTLIDIMINFAGDGPLEVEAEVSRNGEEFRSRDRKLSC